MRCTAGYNILDHRKNEDILEELKVDLVEKKLGQYKQKCLNNVSRINNSLTIDPWSLQKVLDGYSCEAKTGQFIGLSS